MSDSGPLRILHLTDAHILPDAGARFYGIEPAASLRAVIHSANRRSYDLVLFTGDLAQEPVAESYQRLADICAELKAPCYWLPGNHDDAVLARNVLGATPLLHAPVLHIGAWLIVCLDSTLPNSAGGALSAQQLELLDRTLSDNPERHTLIALHHHPIACGSAWMDTMILDNAEEFLRILRRHPQVGSVLHGHTHQAADATTSGIRILGTPSTCIQFKPASTAFALDEELPGYRWLDLGRDGSAATGICRVAASGSA